MDCEGVGLICDGVRLWGGRACEGAGPACDCML